MTGRRSIWLLSAYHADSHAGWAEWLLRNLPFEWQLFSLPGRHFRWRIRGNPLSWMDALPETAPDLILATSMVDLASLRGLRPDLGRVPALLYFHENQFAYPVSRQQHPSIDPQMVQLYAALAADVLVFNSQWNRDSFLQGIRDLTRRVPDHCPRDIAERLLPRSHILPVPVQAVTAGEKPGRLILWNHRWEYDKAPEIFAEAISLLKTKGTDFQLALLGPRAATPHPALQSIRSHAGDNVLIDAQATREQYRHWLGRADIVVSSAVHEFQGIAVLEAVSAGAVPLVPDALCYVEQYAEAYRYPAGDAVTLAVRLEEWLPQPPDTPDISPFLADKLSPQWTATLQRLPEKKP